MENEKIFLLLTSISERLAKMESSNEQKFLNIERLIKNQDEDIKSMEKDLKEVQEKIENKIKTLEKRVDDNEKFKIKIVSFVSILGGIVIFSNNIFKFFEQFFK